MSNQINSTSGTVSFILRDSKSSNETSILFSYSFGRGRRMKYSTGFKTFPKYWDTKNQRIRNISNISNREEVNAALQKLQYEFVKEVTRLENPEDKFNKTFLKNIFNKITQKESLTKSNKIFDFFNFSDNFVQEKENQLNTTNTGSLSIITIRAYKQTIKMLKLFNKEYHREVDFENIDLDFYYSFVQFLEKKGYSLNTIGKHQKNIIALMNRATEEGFNKNMAYKHRAFKRVSENTTAIYLTPDEINRIEKLDLSNNKAYEKARDLFLIGYYTGQRVSDFNGLSIQDIKTFQGQEVFEIKQSKTSKTVFIPVHPNLKSIFKKRYSGKMPSKMPELLLNRYIRKVAFKAGITEDVITTKTKGGKKDISTSKKYELIGTHTARRSFCTNAYLSKMPVIDIMAISGHSTEKEFYKYIKVTPQERAIKIADSAFFQLN